MTISVRLIGGPHDNEVRRVDPDQVEIITHKVIPRSTSARAGGFGLNAATAEVHQTRYTRRVVHCNGDKVIFFALEVMSDLDTLKHALGA